ncbi:hypothetical protein GUJ93_ZPchr0007g3553 [Zizania palustris]|uniref:Uncharacterized protein n=1 Tax=Zizania palustris TaxID=103762 RepID=A0A8J5SJP0_ZIZPA|nr:hypothetical protein GUJ93_ZPchr0007g3553 [Zizania palustris]
MLRMEQQLEGEEDEFQEADILWSDAAQDLEIARMYYSVVDGEDDGDGDDDEYSGQHLLRVNTRGRQIASSPIDIPGRKVGAAGRAKAPAGFSLFGQSLAGAGGGSLSLTVGSHVFVPPHVIIDHRRAKRDKAMMKMMLVVPKGRVRRTMVMRE